MSHAIVLYKGGHLSRKCEKLTTDMTLVTYPVASSRGSDEQKNSLELLNIQKT